MADAAGAAVPAPLLSGLPDEIVVWEILVRLPPKYLLRCRAVCRAWHCATSTGDFLDAHHLCQPSLPILCGTIHAGTPHEYISVFNHRSSDAYLQPVARLEYGFLPEASCDGLLILCNHSCAYSVCNLATRQHAPLPQLSGFGVLAMYKHRPTGEYRLLLFLVDEIDDREDRTGCFILTLGSDQPPRYIGAIEDVGSRNLNSSVLLRGSLHWYPLQDRTGSKVVIVFDTMSESFRHMRAPHAPARSYIFEMDATLAIHSCDKKTGNVNIWVLQNYEGEDWEQLYKIKLPGEEIRGQFGCSDDDWEATVVSVDDDVLLLFIHDFWFVYICIDGELVAKFRQDDHHFESCKLRLKQSLVQHTFFEAVEGYAVNALPFVADDF